VGAGITNQIPKPNYSSHSQAYTQKNSFWIVPSQKMIF